jgi:hypothetical protein
MWRSSSIAKRKPAHVFVAQAAALSLLLGFLPGMKLAYPAVFAAQGNFLFQWLGEQRHVRFLTLAPDRRADGSDTRMLGFGQYSEQPQWKVTFRIWSRGWWPTAVVMAMVLATPLALRRRLRALAAGIALIDLLVLLRVGVLTLALYAASDPRASPRSARVLEVVIESFNSWVPAVASVLHAWVPAVRPATAIDLAASSRWLGHLLAPGRASRLDGAPAQPTQGGGEGAARGVGQKGQEDGESGGDGDQDRGDGHRPGPDQA